MVVAARAVAMTIALALVLGAPVAAAGGPVLLTVSGAIGQANRGPVDPAHDKLFATNDVAFSDAMEFDADALAALPQARVRTDFPQGGEIVTFTGPLLADVLAAAEAEGDTVSLQAMDGYAVEVAAADMIEKGAVVALARDDKPLGIGGFGPTQIVFPRAARADLAEMNDDWWAWQVYHIRVD